MIISSLFDYVLHKKRNLAFSRRSRAKTAKKCSKKCDARAKLLFCFLNPLVLFEVLVAVASLDFRVDFQCRVIFTWVRVQNLRSQIK